MSDRELNFAREILAGRHHRELSDTEILTRAQELLEGWMDGDARMERPKLYDHYALVLTALIRHVAALEERLAALEQR